MVFFWFWGKGSFWNFGSAWRLGELGYLGAGFLVEKHFAGKRVRILSTFQKSLLLSCSLFCCSHQTCAYWVSRFVLYGLTFYHILLITFLDLPFQTTRSQLCMTVNPFHLLSFLRVVFNPGVLILQGSHSQSLCALTRNPWGKEYLYSFSCFHFFFLTHSGLGSFSCLF